MAVVTKVFDVLSRKLQNLKFNNFDDKALNVDENSCSSLDHFINDYESYNIQSVEVPPAQTMDMDQLEKKIKRLINKLKKQNIHLHIFDHTDIHYGPTLGKGGEGIVQKCTIKYNDLLVDAAVKTVLNNTEDALDITFAEIELLCLAKDPIMTTTLQVYGVSAVPDREDPTVGHLVILTEAGIKNVLQLYQDEMIPLHVTYDLWHNMAVSLHCIHKKNIIHQDLKPENILVTGVYRDNYGMLEKVDVKVIDLGMAQLVENGQIVTEDILGTTGYHAPEVLYGDSYNFNADIFVLGITYSVLLLSQACLRKASLQAFLNRIHEAKERGLVGQSLFFSVIQPALDKEISASSSIISMLCKMLERSDKRNISLLDIASTCHKESLQVRPGPNLVTNNPKPRMNHQDSGIESSEKNKENRNNLTYKQEYTDCGKPGFAKKRGRILESTNQKAQSSHSSRTNKRSNPINLIEKTDNKTITINALQGSNNNSYSEKEEEGCEKPDFEINRKSTLRRVATISYNKIKIMGTPIFERKKKSSHRKEIVEQSIKKTYNNNNNSPNKDKTIIQKLNKNNNHNNNVNNVKNNKIDDNIKNNKSIKDIKNNIKSIAEGGERKRNPAYWLRAGNKSINNKKDSDQSDESDYENKDFHFGDSQDSCKSIRHKKANDDLPLRRRILRSNTTCGWHDKNTKLNKIRNLRSNVGTYYQSKSKTESVITESKVTRHAKRALELESDDDTDDNSYNDSDDDSDEEDEIDFQISKRRRVKMNRLTLR